MVEIYPREGTETCAACWRSPAWLLKFIPVRGRKLCHVLKNSIISKLKFIPVRGRKAFFLCLSGSSQCWNLSPWGDGNVFGDFYIFIQVCVEIYPREGTETNWFCNGTLSFSLKFNPVRGRKLRQPVLNADPLRLKFIPVRGRKLTGFCFLDFRHKLKFIPVRGLKRVTWKP